MRDDVAQWTGDRSALGTTLAIPEAETANCNSASPTPGLPALLAQDHSTTESTTSRITRFDANLRETARERPANKEAFLQIKG